MCARLLGRKIDEDQMFCAVISANYTGTKSFLSSLIRGVGIRGRGVIQKRDLYYKSVIEILLYKRDILWFYHLFFRQRGWVIPNVFIL
jgi:hypothetical protein